MNTRSLWAVPLALSLAGAAPAQTPAPVIHRYAAGASGLFVNAYLVEISHGGVTNLIAGRPVPPPILATTGVDSVIRANDAAKEAQWKPIFGDEWPAQRTFPSRIVRDGESVTFDGATFIVHALGPGESFNDSYWV